MSHAYPLRALAENFSGMSNSDMGFGHSSSNPALLGDAVVKNKPWTAAEHLLSDNGAAAMDAELWRAASLGPVILHDGFRSAATPVFSDQYYSRVRGAFHDAYDAAVLTSTHGGVVTGGGMGVAEMVNRAKEYDPSKSSTWSEEEHAQLLDGLAGYAKDPDNEKYMKIALGLSQKTAKDVALRCRWLEGKKNDEQARLAPNHAARNENGTNASNMNQKKQLPSEDDLASSTLSNLLGENDRLLNLIEEDIKAGQLLNTKYYFQRVNINMDAISKRISAMHIRTDKLPPSLTTINQEALEAILSAK